MGDSQPRAGGAPEGIKGGSQSVALSSPPHEAHAVRVHKEPVLLIFVPVEHGGPRNGVVPALADALQGGQLRGKDGGQREVLRSGERGE